MQTLKKYAISLLKASIVIALLVFLYRRGLIGLKETHAILTNWRYTLPAFLLSALGAILGFVRWGILVNCLQIPLHPFRAIQLGYVSAFFGTTLPGSLTGDLVKAFYLGRDSEKNYSGAFTTILIDRVIGVMTKVLLSGAALLLGAASLWPALVKSSMATLILSASGAMIAFFFYLFWIHPEKDPIDWLLAKLEAFHERLVIFKKIYVSLKVYTHHSKAIFISFGISLIGQLCMVFSFLFLERASGLEDPSFLNTTLSSSMGILSTAIPIAPSGIGTGHTAFAYLYQLNGFSHGADLFTVFLILITINNLFGGIFYLFLKSKDSKMKSALKASS